MKQPTIAITGAGGFVGRQLVKYFAAKGWHVLALVRDTNRYKNEKNVQYVSYDLQEPINSSLLKGVNYLVHTAYVKYDRQHPEAYEDNVKGSRQLVTAARKVEVAKVLFLSTMSAHDEAVSVYGKQKVATEKIFTGRDAVILRSGLIIGNGGIVSEMVGFLKTKRVVPLVSGGHQPLQIIAIADLVQSIEQALLGDTTGTLTVANPYVYEYRELYEAIRDELGVKVLFIPVPFWMLLAALRVASVLPLKLPVGEDNLWGLKMLRSVNNADDMHKLKVNAIDLPASLKRSGIA